MLTLMIAVDTCCRDSLGHRSVIDFCIVSTDLFRSVLDVGVKRGAELSTDHHLLVCNLHLEKPPGTTQTCRTRRSCRMKSESLADKDVRKTLQTAYRPCSENSRSAQWTCERSGSCSISAAWADGQKLMSIANIGKKVNPLVETCDDRCYSTIQAKKIARRPGLRPKPTPHCIRGTLKHKVCNTHG